MKAIINKDNDLISRYLFIRKELIDSFKKIETDTDENFKKYWITDFVEKEGKIDSLLYEYDKHISKSKLSKNAYSLIKNEIIELVDDNYIIYEHRYGAISFKTKKERKEWLTKESEDNDYDAFKHFDCFELKPINGNIDNNYDVFNDEFENGSIIIIKSDSLYSDNLIGIIIKE